MLIAVGVLAAYLASAYLTIIGTSDALQALFKLLPPKARVISGGMETEVLTAAVLQGDLLALRPGDRIPVDGEITEGETAAAGALVTRKNLPVEKKPGDKVIAGSIDGAEAVQSVSCDGRSPMQAHPDCTVRMR